MVSFFHILNNDSSFFKFNVARILDNHLNIEVSQLDVELKELYDKDVALAYYYSDQPIPKKFSSKFFDIRLVDKKITLSKLLNNDAYIHPNISLYEEDFPNNALISLAQLAGRFTRFYLDSNISTEKYNELFRNWIIKSVQKEMASHVLIYKINNEITGFATIRKGTGHPHISLLAVDPKFEGKGIAFALLLAIERILLDEGFKYVSGASHIDNLKAMTVYNRHGSEDKRIEYGYHLWRKNIINE